MRRLWAMLGYFLPALILSAQISAPTKVELRNEGAAGTRVGVLDCVGVGVSCSTSGDVGTITVGGGGSPTSATLTWPSSTFSVPARLDPWRCTANGLVGNHIEDLAYAPSLGRFVGVVSVGNNVYSPDGMQWTATSEANIYTGVTWSPDLALFVGVGSNLTKTSADGNTWNAQTPANAVGYSSVAWSSSLALFAAVASNGTTAQQIQTSPDGTAWTARTSPEANQWTDVAWSSDLSLFVAVSQNGTNRVMTSSNGTAWSGQSITASAWQSVAWSPELDLFVAVANGGTTRIATSPNGTAWTDRALQDGRDAAADFLAVGWAEDAGVFIAVSYSDEAGGFGSAYVSSDGITWVRSFDWPEDASPTGIAVATSVPGTRSKVVIGAAPSAGSVTVCQSYATKAISTDISTHLHRFTVTDAGVDASSIVTNLGVRRPDTLDNVDDGLVYMCNVVDVNSGSFDLLCTVNEDSIANRPSGALTFYYEVN